MFRCFLPTSHFPLESSHPLLPSGLFPRNSNRSSHNQPTMAAPAAKKAPSSWTLRFQQHADLTNLARFTDPVALSDLQAAGTEMGFQEEDLRDEEDDPLQVKDADYYAKRRRKQRRFYRRKQTIVLEHGHRPEDGTSGSSALQAGNGDDKVRYEGKISNIEMCQAQQDASFRYVLLQFVRREDGQAEIQVIPAGDLFTFRKTGNHRDELLTEIEDRDLEEISRRDALSARYKSIGAGLAAYDKRKEVDNNVNRVGEDSFSSALRKVFQRTAAIASQGDEGDASAGLGVFLDASGMDADETKEHDFCGGDYRGRFADDEDDHVGQEQETQDHQVEAEMVSSWRFEEDMESEEEAEAEDTKGKDKDKPSAGNEDDLDTDTPAAAPPRMSGVVSGLVSEDMLKAAAAARKSVKKVQAAAMLPPPPVPVLASTPEEVGVKRARTDDQAGLPKKAKGADELDLSAASIKRYIEQRGGRVAVKELSDVFKPAIRAFNATMANKKGGNDRFLSLLEEVTKLVEVPLLGKAFVLKDK